MMPPVPPPATLPKLASSLQPLVAAHATASAALVKQRNWVRARGRDVALSVMSVNVGVDVGLWIFFSVLEILRVR